MLAAHVERLSMKNQNGSQEVKFCHQSSSSVKLDLLRSSNEQRSDENYSDWKIVEGKNLIGSKEQLETRIKQPQQHILWGNVLAIAILHILAVYGFILNITRMKILTILWAFVLWMWAMLGITAGVHRLWSHKSYKAKAPMRLILMIGYAIAAEYPPWDWVLYHRVHHKVTDTDADPHNAKRGLFYSHLGWLMMSKHPETTKEEKRVDMSDIVSDEIFMFFTKYYSYLGTMIGFVIPTMIPILCWNELFFCSLSAQLFRFICDTNFAASINSVSHKYGYRPYKRNILPTEGMITSILTLGEGWHNYHHTFPWDYKASEFGPFNYHLSTTGFINLCAKIGWAYDLKQASPSLVRSIAEKHGDDKLTTWKVSDMTGENYSKR